MLLEGENIHRQNITWPRMIISQTHFIQEHTFKFYENLKCSDFFKYIKLLGLGEIVQWLKAHTALTEELSSVLSTHIEWLTTVHTPAPEDLAMGCWLSSKELSWHIQRIEHHGKIGV